MGLMFFPRGGSAQVTRYLAAALPQHGWDATVLAGSLGAPGRRLPCRARSSRASTSCAVPYDDALAADDPLLADPPMHPSFEDRPGAPDRVFANVDDDTYEHLVEAWIGHLERAGAADADVLHLHHLTPINEAAARAFPDKPVIGHLHGTELLMLREIDKGLRPGLGARRGMGRADAPMGRDAAGGSSSFRPTRIRRAPALLGIEPDKTGRGRRTGSTRRRSTAARSVATEATRALARVAGRGAARLGAGRRAGERQPTTSPTSRRSAAWVPCCSTWAGTRR